MRLLIALLIVLSTSCRYAVVENSEYFVFIGEKISVEPVPLEEGKISLDSKYLAKYKILAPYKGSYNGSVIEFTVFSHRGFPAFANDKYKHVLLYVILHEGRYYHSKYQFNELYKTKDGKWAGPYSTDDYRHEYNKGITINPEIIEFAEPLIIDVSDLKEEWIKEWYPEPYYKRNGGSVIAVYGNYLDDLFLLRQHGVLRSRGDFQEL